MKKHLIEQEWFLLGQPWCHSEESGMDILAGDCDPHAGTYLFSTQVIEDDDYDEEQSKELARDIAEHIIDVHNRSLAEANQPTNCWLDKLRAEQGRVKALERQLADVRQSLQRAEGKVKQYHAYREACEQYIGLARLYLSKNDPHKAYGFLRELCDKLDVVDGDKPTASDGGGE